MNIIKDNNLRLEIYKKENGKVELLKTITNVENIFNNLIVCLYDNMVKRYKMNSTQYYFEGVEYCYMKSTQKWERFNGDEYSYIFIFIGFNNDWGNYLNITKTMLVNKIKIIKESEVLDNEYK